MYWLKKVLINAVITDAKRERDTHSYEEAITVSCSWKVAAALSLCKCHVIMISLVF